MKKILLIHGANLNMLGKRDQAHYGSLTLKELENQVSLFSKGRGFSVKPFQSNYEGAIIDFIQKNSLKAEGIIINPGAFTHYSYAIHDALLDAKIPTIEVHLSDVKNRESFRAISVTAPACVVVFSGEKIKSYEKAIEKLVEHLKS